MPECWRAESSMVSWTSGAQGWLLAPNLWWVPGPETYIAENKKDIDLRTLHYTYPRYTVCAVRSMLAVWWLSQCASKCLPHH